MFRPFDYPEIQELFHKLFISLFSESGRGALMIAVKHVDDTLKTLIEEVLPKDISKNIKDDLFKHMGPIGTVSARIKIAYAFRLIDKNLYYSLNALRNIRNDAAHQLGDYSLYTLNAKMKDVYKLGPSIPYHIKVISTEMMMQSKFEVLKGIFDEHQLNRDDQRTIVDDLLNNENAMESLEKQVPYWELINGLCILCGYIVYHKQKISALTKNVTIWSDLLPSETENSSN